MEASNSRGIASSNGDNHLHAGEPKIKVKVVHGSNSLDIVVPSQSTFGDLKRLIAQKTGLEPNQQRLLFRGKDKEDQEYLHSVGVKDNAKLLLMEVPTSVETKHESIHPEVPETRPEVDRLAEELAAIGGTSDEKKPEEMKSSSKLPIGTTAVAGVRADVDKLADQVAALEAVVRGGTKVGEKDVLLLSELLMRQLLKLDGIEAEGEGRVQRKLEVRRVQSLVDLVDSLKTRNINPYKDGDKKVSVTTEWETFDSGEGNPSALPLSPSSTGESSLGAIRIDMFPL